MQLKESSPAKQDRGHGTRQFPDTAGPKPANGCQADGLREGGESACCWLSQRNKTEAPSAGGGAHSWVRLVHTAFFGLLVIEIAFVWMSLWLPSMASVFGHWPEALFLITATTITLTSLARELPSQNALLAGGSLALAGLGLESLNAATGVPYGSIVFMPQGGVLLFHALPWCTPLLWVLILLNARGVARFLLASARTNPNYGFYVLGLTSLLVIWFDLSFQTFAVQVAHYWKWTSESGHSGWLQVPWHVLLSRGLAALVTLGLVTPVLINKKPATKPLLVFPVMLWSLLLLFLSTATAVRGLWAAFGITLGQIILLAAFVWHRTRGEQA